MPWWQKEEKMVAEVKVNNYFLKGWQNHFAFHYCHSERTCPGPATGERCRRSEESRMVMNETLRFAQGDI